MTRPITRKQPRLAATLVDLVITVLILGILSAVAAPRLRNTLTSMQVEAAARRVACDLNYCKKVAIQTSKSTQIVFRNSPAGYDMQGVTHPAFPSQNYNCNLSDIAGDISVNSINFNGSSALSFNAYGLPKVSGSALTYGSVTLTLRNRSKNVIVNPTTGEAVVQ